VKFHGENVGILWNTENTDDQPVAFEMWICLEGPIFRPQMQRSAKLHWQIQSNERNCVVDTVAASKFTTNLLTSDSYKYFSLVPLNEGWSSMSHFLKGQTERGLLQFWATPWRAPHQKKTVIHFESSDERNSKGRSTSESVLRTWATDRCKMGWMFGWLFPWRIPWNIILPNKHTECSCSNLAWVGGMFLAANT